MGKAQAVRVALTGLADAILCATLAPVCAACSTPLTRPSAGTVCEACWKCVSAPVPPLCRSCGDSLPTWRTISMEAARCAACRRYASDLDVVRAAGDYEGTLPAIVHAFKYGGRRSLASPLGRMMVDAGRDILCDAACVVPVPLHVWRHARRGFNQASDLARRLDRPVVHALWRHRPTAAQSGLTAAARRRNVRAAFHMSPLLSASARDRFIAGRTVVLVDDVRTTGATLEACARVLKRAGAREVRALTLARARLRQPARSSRYI